MRLAAVHAGDVVAIGGPDGQRLGEVRANQRGRLVVAPWPGARTRERAERGEVRLDPITPHITYFGARARDLRTRWTSTTPAVSDSDARPQGDGEEAAE